MPEPKKYTDKEIGEIILGMQNSAYYQDVRVTSYSTHVVVRYYEMVISPTDPLRNGRWKRQVKTYLLAEE